MLGQRLAQPELDAPHQTRERSVGRCTPLQTAAFCDKDANLEQVIEHGRASGWPLDPDETTLDQPETALLIAVHRAVKNAPHGGFPCVKHLIGAGATQSSVV